MTFTYTPQLLTSTGTTASLMKVRRMTGDVDSTWQLLSDEEIYGALTWETSPTLAAAVACDFIAAGFARQCNQENASLRLSAAVRMQHYQELAQRLRKGGAGDVPQSTTVIAAEMYVGGAEQSAKDTLASDTDLVQPPAKIGQDDFPGTDINSIVDLDGT
jgi:hypothetical protein